MKYILVAYNESLQKPQIFNTKQEAIDTAIKLFLEYKPKCKELTDEEFLVKNVEGYNSKDNIDNSLYFDFDFGFTLNTLIQGYKERRSKK